jgi:glycosyltransferase involved in cell wall biosynthesis
VGTVGRLVDIKRPDVFLQTASLVAQRRPDAHFVVAGDGYLLEPSKRRAASLGIGDRVHFLGWTRELAKVYADLDVFLLTSRNEGTPVSVIEALAAGARVVATAVGGVPDVLEGGRFGRLIAPDDPASAGAEAVCAALEASQQGEAGAGGRKERFAPTETPRIIAERYSARRMLDETESLYRALLRFE